MSLKQWDFITRFLHLGLAITVTAQIALSLIMHVPKPGREISWFAHTAFTWHMYVGVAAFFIVLVHWFWTAMVRSKVAMPHFFPWNQGSRQAVIQDIVGLGTLKLPKGGPRAGLPGLIHGLGFISVTFTEKLLWFCMLACN